MRITITTYGDVDATTAADMATRSIKYWEAESNSGEHWSPGAIAIFRTGGIDGTNIATSTTRTLKGWSVRVWEDQPQATAVTQAAPVGDPAQMP